VRWDQIRDLPCSVARTLSAIGDRWTLLVLRDLFLGARRFEQLEASLGCSPHLLSTRLGKLCAEGIVERRLYRERPERHEYRLTEKGRDLYPVIASLLAWGDRWMSDPHGPPVVLEHRPCGQRATPELRCSECGEPIDPREMRAHLRAERPS
jgi:DNA-binding HxlR family transcriptional regulator